MRAFRDTHHTQSQRRQQCQDELVIRAGKTNLCRVARPVRMVISHARIARTVMNTASFVDIRSDSSERRCNPAHHHKDGVM